jgi:hypothetical protein
MPASGITGPRARLQVNPSNGPHQPILCQIASPSAHIACNLAHLTVSMEAPVLAAANIHDGGCLANMWRPGQFCDLENEHKA